jgi:shikimate kinase
MNRAARQIVIAGFMGAGKTTVAAALARRLACEMIDLDRFIEERVGRSAQAIIDEEGEPRFRELESEMLREALEADGARVIALGGGAWTIERNRALIKERGGLTIWLDAPFDLCWRRIERTSHTRPLARDEAQARELYHGRRPLYALAGLHVKADERSSAKSLAARIEEAILKMGERQ